MRVWKVGDICICMKHKPCWISSSAGCLREQSSALAFPGRWRINDAPLNCWTLYFYLALHVCCSVIQCWMPWKPFKWQLPPKILLIPKPLILVWTCNLQAFLFCMSSSSLPLEMVVGDSNSIPNLQCTDFCSWESWEDLCVLQWYPLKQRRHWRAWICSECFLTPGFLYYSLTCAPGFLQSLGHEITPVIWTHGKRLNWRGPCTNGGGSRAGCC